MNLIKCYIENFGILHNYTYQFKNGLNIIREDNGFGKTTFAVFIKSMFYGLDASNKAENSDRKKYKPWQGGIFGGNIEFELNGKKYRVERFFGIKAADDTFKLYDLSTNLESNDFTENIGEEIFKINKTGYERSTYIPQGQIQIEMEDSLNAKLGNILESENDINSSDEALKNITEVMKVYKKTGDRGLLNEKKEKLNELQRKLENAKTDVINLETRENILKNLELEIKQKNEIKKQKQELLSKKIEQGRKQAKQETYNNILEKVNENENKYNKLMEFFNSDVPEDDILNDLNLKIIEIEKSKVEINNNILSDEDQNKLEELKEKFEGSSFTEEEIQKELNKIEKNKGKGFKILAGIGVLATLLGIVLIILDISKICGVTIIILGMISVIFSILNNKNANNAERIISLTNLKTELLTLHELEAKKQTQELIKKDVTTKIENKENEVKTFLKQYFNILDKPYTELIQEIRLKKNELILVLRELENFKKLKSNYEETNNIQELTQEETLENINEEELTEDIKTLEFELDKLNDEKNQNKNQIEILENKIDENDYIENDYENLKEEIEYLEQKYKTLEQTKKFLLEAKQSFSSSYLREMIDGFDKYLSIINSDDLNTDVDINLDVKIEVNGAKKDIKNFSAGYKDLIYICMRFSLVKALFKEELPFVILDDPFVNLDDEKTNKALNLLNEFSKEYQVIYLVCNTSRVI